MKTYRSHPIKNPKNIRVAQLLGIAIWASHYHSGQGSREYRMGCRAGALIKRTNEIGNWLFSRWFDQLEGFCTGESPAPTVLIPEFSEAVKKSYEKMITM